MTTRRSFAASLNTHPAVIAVLHAPPLPGSARSSLSLAAITARVTADAEAAIAKREAIVDAYETLAVSPSGDAMVSPSTASFSRTSGMRRSRGGGWDRR